MSIREPKEVRLSLRVTPEFLDRVKNAAMKKGVLMSGLVITELSKSLDAIEADSFEESGSNREEIELLKRRLATVEALLEDKLVGCS